MITVDPDSSVPLYKQIHDETLAAIATGALPSGAKLDSVRAVAAEFGINPATVKQAYDLLQEEGVIVTRGRKGSFVAAQRNGSHVEFRIAVHLLLAQGYTFSEIRELVDSFEQDLQKGRPCGMQ